MGYKMKGPSLYNSMKPSKNGYKRDSKDVNKPMNLIDSGDITMKGVDFPVYGRDNLGNEKIMKPGKDYKFPGDKVLEIPLKKAEPRRTIGRGKNFNPVSEDKSATGGAAGGGMTEKGVREYKSKNPGSKLQTAVTKKPSELKPGSKDAKRRKSFCARSKSWTSERGKAARRRWNC